MLQFCVYDCLSQCFLTFFDFVHPNHWLLHSHSPYCECTANVTTIIVQYIECSLLYHSIFSTLYTACFAPCSKLARIFKYVLIADSASQNVSLFTAKRTCQTSTCPKFDGSTKDSSKFIRVCIVQKLSI